MRDLSVCIAARNEEFLLRTVEGVLKNKRANTEVIVIADGAWPVEPLPDHPDLTLVYHPVSIGQRAAVNEAVRLSRAKFIMKLDAHCIVDEGFDVKLMAECEEKWTVIPRMFNLHAFDWRCKKCGKTWYQGPTPTYCIVMGRKEKRMRNEACDSTQFERVMVWRPKTRANDFMQFDQDLHFQYWGELGKRAGQQGQIADTMSNLGACFFMHRSWYWAIDGLDEKHGSWGQMGTEISCKTWLGGGRQVVNKNTWFSHLFRTQGGDFGFPYQHKPGAVEAARQYSQDMWRKGLWPKAIHPLEWLLEKFWPIPRWDQAALDEVKATPKLYPAKHDEPTKGIIYYTDNKLNIKLARACRRQLLKAGLPIVSASLKPMDFGTNIYLPLQRGYLTMFKQILAALEASTAQVVFFCEHDVLYHPSHFDFTPPKKDVFYYNENIWKMDAAGTRAIAYDCKQVSGICVYRETAITHYRERVRRTEELENELLTAKEFNYKIRRMGFEAGTHTRAERVDTLRAERWMSPFPNVDIRHESNLTPTRWRREDFRDARNCQNWQETTTDIDVWGTLKEIAARFS